MHTRRRRLIARFVATTTLGALALAMAALAMAAPSMAAGHWSKPQPLGAPKDAWEVAVASDPAGDAVAAWVSSATVPYRVLASIRVAGATMWGTPAIISTKSAWNPAPPVIRMDAAGNAFVAWQDQGDIFIAIHPFGASRWIPARAVATGSMGGFAVDPAGDATLFFGGGGPVQVIDRPAGGVWSAPVTVATPGPNQISGPAGVAMAADGTAVAIWETWEPAPDPIERTNYILHAARRSGFKGTWEAPTDLSTPLAKNYGHAGSVAVDAHGDAVVVGRQLAGDPRLVIQAVTQPAGGSWTSPVSVSAADADAGYPSAAVDASGDAVLAWATDSTIFTSTAVIPANTWTPPVQLSATGSMAGYPLAFSNGSGAAAVVWPAGVGGAMDRVVVAVRSVPGGAWQASMVARAANELSVGSAGIDAAGRTVVVWNETPPTWFGQSARTSTYTP